MPGLGIIIPRSGGSTGPVIPSALHSAGVTGWDHRFVADRIATAVNQPVALWPDAATPATDLASGTGTGTATLTTENGQLFARLDNFRFSPAANYTTPRTLALVCRTTATALRVWQGLGWGITRASNGQWQVAPYNGSGGYVLGAAGASWVCVVARLDAAAPAINVNGTDATTLTGTAITAGANTVFGMRGETGKVADFIEAITWPTYLDATQRGAVYTAMKAHYGALLP